MLVGLAELGDLLASADARSTFVLHRIMALRRHYPYAGIDSYICGSHAAPSAAAGHARSCPPLTAPQCGRMAFTQQAAELLQTPQGLKPQNPASAPRHFGIKGR